MRQMQSLMITCIAVAVLAVPSSLEAQGRRGGGVGLGAGGAGRVSIPPVTTPQLNMPRAASRAPDSAMGAGRTGGTLGDAGLNGNATAATRIQNNAELSTRVRPLLPPGSDLGSAAAGFRNETDFLAALHASRSLGIPFDDVRNKMTGSQGQRLDKAIQTLRPELDKKTVKQSVKKAERMASDDVRAAARGQVVARTHPESRAATEIRMNQGLSARVTQLLPEEMSLDQAASGFRNTGQFVAALHVARNLGIPFSELRGRMIAGGESLGEAIHGTRPAMADADIETNVQTAVRAAEQDLAVESAVSAQATGTQKQIQ